MKTNIPKCILIGVGLVAVAAGCRTSAIRSDSTTTDTPTTQTIGGFVLADNVPQGGANLWSQNCMRCHGLRSPRERSDRQWAVIVHHMRIRANLTAGEHREILEFLQAAN